MEQRRQRPGTHLAGPQQQALGAAELERRQRRQHGFARGGRAAVAAAHQRHLARLHPRQAVRQQHAAQRGLDVGLGHGGTGPARQGVVRGYRGRGTAGCGFGGFGGTSRIGPEHDQRVGL